MRNPGWDHEQVWTASCDVLFNDVDFGPNLQYGKLTFLPAEIRRQQLKIAGMPGNYDYSKSPNGYPVLENIKGTLELFVVDPLAWQTPVFEPELQQLTSPEGRFMSMINAGPVRLRFINTNRFFLVAWLKVTKYTRFDLAFNITLSVEAEPYWWEGQLQETEWSFNAPSVNLFDPEDVTITPYLPTASCDWHAAPGDPDNQYFLLHAPNGGWADVEIPNLNPSKTYSFYARNIFNRGVYKFFDEDGNEIYTITGVETLTVRLISRSAQALAVGFADVTLYDVTGAGLYTSAILTLDAPMKKLQYRSNQNVKIMIGEEVYNAPAGSDMELVGLNIPPRSRVPVTISGWSGCRGSFYYRRGAAVCTL